MTARANTIACFVLTALTAAATAASGAEGSKGLWTLGVTGGTLGAGPELAYRYGSYLGVRANAGFLSYSHDETVDQITYDGRLKLESFGLMADWYPAGGGFRLSAGARRNDNKIDLTGISSTPVTIGNNVYTPAQLGTVYGTVRANSFAPTLSVGYGGALAKGFTLGVDLGVMFQGSPRVDNYHATGMLAADPTLQTDLATERSRVEDKVHSYQYWPVAQIELLYRF